MRKNGRTLLAMMLVLVFTLGFCGCGKDKALYEQGTSIVSLMKEMAESEAYMTVSASERITSKLDAVRAGDYSAPEAVYKLSVQDETLYSLTGMELTGISDELRNCIGARAYYALLNQINARDGAETIAAASICSVSKSFADKGLKGSEIVLYQYAEAPATAVVFTAGDDGTVYASGTFILYDGFKADTAESIEDFFNGMVEAKKIK